MDHTAFLQYHLDVCSAAIACLSAGLRRRPWEVKSAYCLDVLNLSLPFRQICARFTDYWRHPLETPLAQTMSCFLTFPLHFALLVATTQYRHEIIFSLGSSFLSRYSKNSLSMTTHGVFQSSYEQIQDARVGDSGQSHGDCASHAKLE